MGFYGNLSMEHDKHGVSARVRGACESVYNPINCSCLEPGIFISITNGCPVDFETY
jgi:hypothetical protein